MSEVPAECHQPKAEAPAGPFVPDPSFITYDCPQGGLNPFDVEEPATQHLFEAAGGGLVFFSRAWIGSKDPHDKTDKADQDAEAEAYYGGIPPARANQYLWEKLAVIHQGRLIAAWPETAMPLHRPDDPTPYRVLNSRPPKGGHGRQVYEKAIAAPYEHQSYDQALTAALELTRDIGEAVMVTRLLAMRSLY